MDWNLHRAMLNSYYVIIRGYDPLLIIHKGRGFFAHDPSEDLLQDDIEGVLEYFEEQEEYDKCIEISEFIKEKWNLDNIKKK